MGDITPLYTDPPHTYFTGLLGTSSSIGGKVAQLGDHWYELDLESDRFRYSSVPALRPQQDVSERPGEGTLSVEGLWKRFGSTWHSGAGQRWYDRNDADATRFYHSRGVEVFNEWELSLLHDTASVATSAAGWTSMAVGSVSGVGTRLAVAGTGTVRLFTTTGTMTTVAGLTGRCWVTSTGGRIYVSDDTGVHTITSATATTSFSTEVTAPNLIFYGKNRLFALKADDIYDLPAAGGAATPISLDYLDGWQWTGATSGQEALFFCGYAGDKGGVFAVSIAEDGTTLNPPTLALPLPDGELPLCIYAYTNLVLIGTNLGVRVCTQNGQALQMGELVGQIPGQTDPVVRCLEPQNHFVWFGWDNTFIDAAGLGRIDLRTFVDEANLAPAFASDLMSQEVGQTTAVITFGGRRWFSTGLGIYRQTDDYVETGEVESGRVTFNLADEKTPVFADVRHSVLQEGETVVLEVGTDTRPYEFVGESVHAGTSRPLKVFSLPQNKVVYNELRVTLNGIGDRTPILTNVTIGVQVAPDRSFNIFLPLLIHETIHIGDRDYGLDVAEELQFLFELVSSQRIIRFQQGRWTGLVVCEDFEWIPHHSTTGNGEDMNGTMVLKLKSAEVVR